MTKLLSDVPFKQALFLKVRSIRMGLEVVVTAIYIRPNHLEDDPDSFITTITWCSTSQSVQRHYLMDGVEVIE